MKNIGKIYISREKIGTYGGTTKYFVRKILIEDANGNAISFFELSKNYAVLSKQKKKKQLNKINAFLKKWATKFTKQQKKSFDSLKNDGSVIVVDSDNLEINQYIDNKIGEYQYSNCTDLQSINITLLAIHDDLVVCKNLIKRNFILKNNKNPFTYVEGLENMSLVSSRNTYVAYLMEALDLNPFLDENDREIALKLETYLKENPYLDYEKMYDKFSEIFVVHSNQDKGTTAGQHDDSLNGITTYAYAYNEYYDSILFHEFIHTTGRLPYFALNEGMTELLNAEYFNNGSIIGYSGSVNLTKIFCELIGSDKMLEAFSKEDMSIIETELLKLNNDPQFYQKLTNLLQKYSESDGLLYGIEFPKYSYQFVNIFKPYITSELVTPEKRVWINA